MASKGVESPSHARAWLRAGALAAGAALIALAFSVTSAFANAGNPDSAKATWSYSSGSSGPVTVTVSGTWDWGSNSVQGGGPGSQSCWNGGKQDTVSGYDDVNGHWAIGLAVDWGDSTVVPTKWKLPNGQVFAATPGKMDWLNPNYCAGTTTSAPYPSGTWSASHTYDSLSAFLADTNNGEMCVNAYDVHNQTDSKEQDPTQNGDNTITGNHYDMNGVDCAVAQPANGAPPSPPSPPAQPTALAASPPATPATAATPATPATPAPAIEISKLERDETTGGQLSVGPITVDFGNRVAYQVAIYNSGNVDLVVHLVDPGCVIRGGSTLDISGISLAVHQTKVYHCSHVISAADSPVYTNTATANGVAASTSVNASSTVAAAPAQASVKANVPSVLGARKVVTHHAKKTVKAHKAHKTHAAPKKVVVRAKPAAPKVRKASFTG